MGQGEVEQRFQMSHSISLLWGKLSLVKTACFPLGRVGVYTK